MSLIGFLFRQNPFRTFPTFNEQSPNSLRRLIGPASMGIFPVTQSAVV